MTICKVCKEKDYELTDKDKQIKRILDGYKKDKKMWLKIFKILGIAIGVLILELIFSLAFGKEGITLAIDYIIKIVK